MSLPLCVFQIVYEGQPFIGPNLKHCLGFADHISIVEGATSRESPELGVGKRIHGSADSKDGTLDVLISAQRTAGSDRVYVTSANGEFWPDKTTMVKTAVERLPCPCILMQVDCDEFWTLDQVKLIRALMDSGDYSDLEFNCLHFWGDNRHYTSLDHTSWGGGTAWRRVFEWRKGDRVESHEPPRFWRPTQESVLPPSETRALGLVFQHYSYAFPQLLWKKERFYGLKPGELTGPMEAWVKAGKPLDGQPCGRLERYDGPHLFKL